MLTHSVTEGQREEVILRVRRVTECYILAQRADFHIVEVIESLFEGALRQFHECLCIRSLGILDRVKRFDVRLRQRFSLHALGVLVEGDGHVVRIEVFLGYACNLLLGEVLDLLVRREDVIHRFAIRESIHKDVHLGGRRLVECLITLRVHVFYVRNQFIGNLAAFDLVNLTHDNRLGSLVGLIHPLVGIVVRHSHYEHTSVVAAGIRESIGCRHVTLGVHLVQ